jgi:uncharacterized protein YraI
MNWFWYYLLFQICIIIFFWIFSKLKDKRYKINNTLTEDFEPTQEVSIDPVSKVLKRVYVNRKTGERKYIDEKGENDHNRKRD